MKIVTPIPFIAIAILLMVNGGCKKNISAGILTYTNTPQPPQAKLNTAPSCYAGQDLLIFLPTNSCLLYGIAHDGENNISTVLWSKISGPSLFLIEHPDSLSTKVSNLESGVYIFELNVTDSIGLYGKDTIKVTVSQLSVGSGAAPNCYAGWDFLVELPANESLLDGHASDLDKDIQEYSWAKIAGPASYTLDNKNAAQTLVRSLEKGVYQFELTVTDRMGHFDKDTVLVTVGELSANPKEIIFNDLPVICPWDCGIEIANFYSYVAPGTYFKIFIKRDNNPNWVEAIPELKYFDLILGYYGNESSPYEYFIEGRPDGAGMYRYGSLYVFYYGTGIGNKLSVKIMYD